jgi:hypothetical protein
MVHTQPIKRPSIGFDKRAKGQPKAPLVWRTGLSGAPPDMSGAPEDSKLKLVTFGKFQRQLRYNSPDMSGAPRKSGLRNSPASGIQFGCSAIIHRTCPVYTGLSGVTAGQWLLQAPTATCDAINARQRAQWLGTPMLAHQTLYSTCPVRHRTSRRVQKSELQRSEPNGFGDVAVAPDCPVHPRTDSLHQTASLVVGAINNSNHPTFKSSKFSTSQPLTRARHSIRDTPKRSNPLQFHKVFSD